jgi:hypothetical protein
MTQYDAAFNPVNTATFDTADAAIEQMLREGWERDNYDPLYPFSIAWNDGDGMRGRVVFCNYRQRYIIEGLRI